jgi:hypothetical protein
MGLAEHIPEETTSSSFYRELNPKFLKEIYIKAQNELRDLKKAIESNEITPWFKDKNEIEHSVDPQHCLRMM